MRSIIPFNHDWLFAPHDVAYSAPDDGFTPVVLPHTNITLPMRNFDNQEYQFISTYRRRFTLPEPHAGRRVFIDFEGAMTSTTVLINGVTLGDHDGGYVPFSFELTEHLRDGENTLQVRLDSTERPDVPPNGALVDYLTFGGIYREVALRLVEPLYIERVFAAPRNVLSAPALDVHVTLSADLPADHTLHAALIDADGVVIARAESRTPTIAFAAPLPVALWSPDAPHLYTVEVTLAHGETPIDRVRERTGFRHAVFQPDGFYLNGSKLKLVGLNRHQTYPYIGAAAPARLQRKDADILKHEIGVNMVRTSHYPQSRHFLDRCDEIGLLVMEEIPGWQFIGDSDWQALTLRDVRVMIERDRSRPSIILWGVRINESGDNHALYTATNALARQLDPTRQTGGVRFFQESEFLEDVFTYNDFSDTVVAPLHTPHLITEYAGHRFSTKTSDNEDRQIAHALLHAHIQDRQHGRDDVCGAIGWCFFDYNTHREFGSGDRVCYHGVTDMFRLPKMAAYVYESQLPHSVRPVLRPLTLWAAGDRAGGGFAPLYVFTNCDRVELFVGDMPVPGERAADEYPHLPNPPFKFSYGLKLEEGLLYNYHDLKVIGYIGGQPAAAVQMRADGLPHRLTLEPDDAELIADGSDMTRLVLKVVDSYGSRLAHADPVVSLSIEGEGELIGDNPFVLIGGQGALYVRSTRRAGTIHVRASAPRCPPVEAVIVTG
jgi:beta-galactosidase